MTTTEAIANAVVILFAPLEGCQLLKFTCSSKSLIPTPFICNALHFSITTVPLFHPVLLTFTRAIWTSKNKNHRLSILHILSLHLHIQYMLFYSLYHIPLSVFYRPSMGSSKWEIRLANRIDHKLIITIWGR